MNLVLRDAVETPAEDAGLLQLIQNSPMQGMVQLSLERQPSFFDSIRLSGQNFTVKVVEDTDEEMIVGCFGFAYKQLYINGHTTEVRYLLDLRIHPEYRGKGVFKMLAKGFKKSWVTDGWKASSLKEMQKLKKFCLMMHQTICLRTIRMAK
ncbi:MAG: GNAT family N-acetyltransferase [Pseudomonadota bacterium]